MANVKWKTTIKNTGIQHDMIVGCSLLDSAGNEQVRFPWWVVRNVPSETEFWIQVTVTGVPAGNYLGKCRAWTGYTPGTKIQDFTIDGLSGTIYASTWEDLLQPPILDEATQNIIVPSVGISADITQFSLAV